jgi:hypothetical protein
MVLETCRKFEKEGKLETAKRTKVKMQSGISLCCGVGNIRK